MAVTKADLVEILCAKTTLTKQDAKDLVENFFNEIATTLMQGDMVKISGFGNFTVRNKSARIGRNPRTGKEATISQRRVVTFKPGQKLKSLLAHLNIEPQLENQDL